MNAPHPIGAHADLRAQLAENIVQNTDMSLNLGGRIIMCTEDKVRLAVLNHLSRMQDAHDWWAPCGVLVSILLVFVTADFKLAFGLSAATWTAVFLIAAVLSVAWLIRALLRLARAPSADDFINSLKPALPPQPPASQMPAHPMVPPPPAPPPAVPPPAQAT
jgi:hypothetical protein